MPLYEYTCRKCEHTFEALVTARVTSAVACPKCEGEDLDQLIGLPAPGRVTAGAATNCRGDGPPCGAPRCGRKGT
jgi:putative FmdB family regulatory protein